MACTIYLVRHGIAADATAGQRDADRRLTEEGKRKVVEVARGLQQLGVRPDAVLSSPLPRASQTASRLAATLTEKAIAVYPPLAAGAVPARVLDGLAPYRDATELMLVGHEPDLGMLASCLLTSSEHLVTFEFKKAAVVAIQVSSIPPRSRGVLLWFMTAKHLRAIGSAPI